MRLLSEAVRNRELFRTACLFAGIMALLLLVPAFPLAFKRIAFWCIFSISAWAACVAIAQQKHTLGSLSIVAAIAFNPFVLMLKTATIMWMADALAAALLFTASQVIDPSTLRFPAPEEGT
jgi:hypothetical protein